DSFATGPSSPPPGCPAHTDPAPLYGPEFAADPARTYSRLRRYGAVAPVELAPGVPGTLVIGYEAALEVLRDPITFPTDPRRCTCSARCSAARRGSATASWRA